ncbi:SDR family NAD(P)-dependent oxidoreductase [Pedobacter westerhofensis]|uniref:SDR family NAD(P)-dependent oxidoreductase n=1 Tax=Pedobacter westerhofensis TaxID=425512 RepID=UPI003743C6CE
MAENHSDVNVLINNAGIQNWMTVSDENFYQKASAVITTNFTYPVHLTNPFLGLTSLDTIINVTSGLAFVQLTKVPVYCATKAFFHTFTNALRYMLKARNIEVTEIIPPGIRYRSWRKWNS